MLDSIQTSDSTICLAKTTIQADATKKNNFESVADFVLATLSQHKFEKIPHNISCLGTKRGVKRGNIRTDPKTGVELRFYKKARVV